MVMCEICKKRESTRNQIVLGKDLCLICYRKSAKAQAEIVEKLAKEFKLKLQKI